MIALLALCIWLYLFLAHGRFWSSEPELAPAAPAAQAARTAPMQLPDVDVVVPARDEAQTIGPVIASLLSQDYAGKFRVILVDDDSADDTAHRAGSAPNLLVIRGEAKPAGWSGKLWALHQGVAASRAAVLLFTDADIVHDRRHLAALAARLLEPRVDMVSEMVRLNCASFAERALVPAFVYFFQMLYPFAKVNDPRSRAAAAAGGTIMIRREALQRIGGIGAIKHALIDDVALAKAVKAGGAIYLGHSALAASIRAYPHFRDIWRMISRTAFTQLRCSAALLVLTLLGLTLVWLVPMGAMIFGNRGEAGCGLAAFALAAITYMPSLARYGRSRLWSLALPLIALFYMAATLGSALNHWRGAGARWKDRAYGAR
jgi:hopene-associated glycosyltransferase HpnB